jgi:hypothetical protein
MYTFIGVIGAALILFGFYRISVVKWTGKSLWYEIDNFFGAILIGIYQLHHKAYISLVINIVWATVAFRGLSSYAERSLRARKSAVN